MKKLLLFLLVAGTVAPALGWWGGRYYGGWGRGWGRGCYGCGYWY